MALGIVLLLTSVKVTAGQSTAYLPLVTTNPAFCQVPASVRAQTHSNDLAPSGSPAAKDVTRILPVGNQLGDVGQYYSQVAPSLSSTIRITNLTTATQVYTVTLYGDTGFMVRSLEMCRIDPDTVWALQALDGELVFRTDAGDLAPSSVCSIVKDGEDEQGYPEPLLHGLYHAQITAGEPSSLNIRIHTSTDASHAQMQFHTNAAYNAVPGGSAGSFVHLPGILATRDREVWWDTEVVVQNVSNASISITFQLCTDSGHCFDNNAAQLDPYERRLFLASHLLYEDSPDGLVEHEGWLAGTVKATHEDGPDPEAKIVVATHYFRQVVEPGSIHPKAERGSTCFHSATQPISGRILEIPITGTEPLRMRIYNPTSQAALVTLNLLANEQLVDTRAVQIAAHGSWNSSAYNPANGVDYALEMGEAALPTSSGATKNESGQVSNGALPPLTLRIEAPEPISVLAWDSEGIVQAQAQPDDSGRWYAPIVAAPIVSFRWDEGRDLEGAEHPGSQFGLAETRPSEHYLRPNWARQLNWYDARYRAVGFERRWCNETVDADESYSTYIPLWRGLGWCNDGLWDDRSCLNTDTRFQEIRNSLPSSCVGRPLFLANEPDLSGQTFMTFHELGRLIYVLRDWPGELFSPVFASYSYERPIYPPEGEHCRELVEQSLCPQTPGCEFCVQDGIVDGKSDPFDISFQGLELYFAEPNLWAKDQIWRFDDFVEGMLVHFYDERHEPLDDEHWRVPYLHQYRDRANEAGWPIIVKEYGFVVWPNEHGVIPDINQSKIADRLDDVRRFLQRHLGNSNGEEQSRQSPLKLIWYQTGCDSLSSVWGMLCLFRTPQELLDPVGTCWHDDAARNDDEDRQCGQGDTG